MLGTTKVFIAQAEVNNGQQLTAIARDDGSLTPFDLVDGDASPVHDFAAIGDNLAAVVGTEIRIYPADGSPKVSIAGATNPFGLAFADGFLWFVDGNTIKRVRITP